MSVIPDPIVPNICWQLVFKHWLDFLTHTVPSIPAQFVARGTGTLVAPYCVTTVVLTDAGVFSTLVDVCETGKR